MLINQSNLEELNVWIVEKSLNRSHHQDGLDVMNVKKKKEKELTEKILSDGERDLPIPRFENIPRIC